MRHLALVAPHFVPSNMTSMHRARFFATYLPEFGWEPTVVTVHEKFYEGALEPELSNLLPSGLRVRKASAWPVKPLRVVGDIGVRGFGGLFREIGRLHRDRPVDFLLVTIPSNFAAPLGWLSNRRFGIPYGIDYQDPWVHEWPGCRVFPSKAWVSYRLARVLEPLALSRASLVTGISEDYFGDVFTRHPEIRGRVVTAAMPNGWGDKEYAYLDAHPRPARLFGVTPAFRMVYAGAVLPKSVPVARAFFRALAGLRDAGRLPERFEAHFIGTGRAGDAAPSKLAAECGAAGLVIEHSERLPFLDVLAHLRAASAVLVIGSTQPHYSPSKIYEAVLSRRPVLALLHRASSALPFLGEAGTASIVTFGDDGPGPDEVREGFLRLQSLEGRSPSAAALERVSARLSTRTLAAALDRALEARR